MFTMKLKTRVELCTAVTACTAREDTVFQQASVGGCMRQRETLNIEASRRQINHKAENRKDL